MANLLHVDGTHWGTVKAVVSADVADQLLNVIFRQRSQLQQQNER